MCTRTYTGEDNTAVYLEDVPIGALPYGEGELHNCSTCWVPWLSSVVNHGHYRACMMEYRLLKPVHTSAFNLLYLPSACHSPAECALVQYIVMYILHRLCYSICTVFIAILHVQYS